MKYHLISMMLFFVLPLLGQFELIGDAEVIGPNTYKLTEDLLNENGSIWHSLRHDFSTDFRVEGEFYFGEDEDGADGIVFVVQDNCIGEGGLGLGLGYGGFPGNSIGIEFDTYQNVGGLVNDPVADHIALSQNGNIDHNNNLIGPIQMHMNRANVEDGNWYPYVIDYNATSQILEVNFDGDLRLTYMIDIVNDVLLGNPYAYWGFTSATGGFSAPNSLSILEYNAFNIKDMTTCNEVEIDMMFSSANYLWSPDDGSISDINGQVVTLSPTMTTTYTVSVSDICLGSVDYSFTIDVTTNMIDVTQTDIDCGEQTRGSILIEPTIGNPPYRYSIDDGLTYSLDNQFLDLPVGTYSVIVLDNEGCSAREVIEMTSPIAITIDAGIDQTIIFGETVQSDASIDPLDTDIMLQWSPSEGLSCDTCLNPMMMPTASTQYILLATDSDGCTISDSVFIEVSADIMIEEVPEHNVYIPNIFTPYTNDSNSVFTVFGGDDIASILMMEIYDRWGNMVYSKRNFPSEPLNGWDGTFGGTHAEAGVYVYLVSVLFDTEMVVQYTGDVMMIR